MLPAHRYFKNDKRLVTEPQVLDLQFIIVGVRAGISGGVMEITGLTTHVILTAHPLIFMSQVIQRPHLEILLKSFPNVQYKLCKT